MCEYVDLVKETRAKVLCYADAKDWQVIKKSVNLTIIYIIASYIYLAR